MIPAPSRRVALALTVLALAAVMAACTSGAGGAPAASTAASPAASPAVTTAPSVAGAPTGCPTSQPEPLGAGETRTVTIQTDKGDMTLALDADLSPIAVGNFVALADCGYYDGVIFHRVVPGFVIQGGDGEHGRVAGDPLVGTGGPGYEIQDEPVTATYQRGTVAMARSSAPNSVGSQFFIVLDDNAATSLADPSANNYQIIGEVTAGMEVADAIAAAADAEIPTNPVTMTKVTVANP